MSPIFSLNASAGFPNHNQMPKQLQSEDQSIPNRRRRLLKKRPSFRCLYRKTIWSKRICKLYKPAQPCRSVPSSHQQYDEAAQVITEFERNQLFKLPMMKVPKRIAPHPYSEKQDAEWKAKMDKIEKEKGEFEVVLRGIYCSKYSQKKPIPLENAIKGAQMFLEKLFQAGKPN